MRGVVFLLHLIGFSLIYSGPATGSIDATLRPNDLVYVQLGKEIYKNHCSSCHGLQLEGQKGWQTKLVDGMGLAPPHDASGHTWHHPDDYLFAMTKFGIKKLIGQRYPNNMPAYEEILKDEEIIAVLSYIKSTWPDQIEERHNKINQNYKATRDG